MSNWMIVWYAFVSVVMVDCAAKHRKNPDNGKEGWWAGFMFSGWLSWTFDLFAM